MNLNDEFEYIPEEYNFFELENMFTGCKFSRNNLEIINYDCRYINKDIFNNFYTYITTNEEFQKDLHNLYQNSDIFIGNIRKAILYFVTSVNQMQFYQQSINISVLFRNHRKIIPYQISLYMDYLLYFFNKHSPHFILQKNLFQKLKNELKIK